MSGNTEPEWWDVESLAKRLAVVQGHDPERLILPPGLVPLRIEVMGQTVMSADGPFTPVPLWQAYVGIARDLIKHKVVIDL